MVVAAAANVLVVDDRDDVIQNVRDAFQSCADITVMTAQGVAEAEVLLRDHFFVAAFIDLYIVEPGDAGQAQELVRFIQDWRPTAKAILVTENEQTGWHHLLDFVDTTRGSVSSIWRRTTGMPYADVIREVVRRHGFVATIAIEPMSEIIASLGPRLEGHCRWLADQLKRPIESMPRLSQAEVSFVVTQLLRRHALRDVEGERLAQFGDRSFKEAMDARANDPHEQDDHIVSVRLTEMGRGKSSSAVFKGNPTTKRGDGGILCIMKLGPRSEILAEVSAFDKYVRFSRSTYRRVEVLSHCLADTIGGVCYSFAGSSPDGSGVESLQDVIDRGDVRRAASILRTELNPEQKEWYAKVAVVRQPLTAFFSAPPYSLKLPDHLLNVKRQAQQFCDERADSIGGQVHERPEPSWDYRHLDPAAAVIKLPMATDIARLNIHLSAYRSCIVHGDMNGENLIVAAEPERSHALGDAGEIDQRVILIDYRQTRRGPVFVDFAALEATVRLSTPFLSAVRVQADYQQMTTLVRDEAELLTEAWLAPAEYERARREPVRVTGRAWYDLSFEIVQLARGNFVNDQDCLAAKREYAATCLLYALRLFKIKSLSEPYQDAARVRLMIWMSALVSFLRAELQ